MSRRMLLVYVVSYAVLTSCHEATSPGENGGPQTMVVEPITSQLLVGTQDTDASQLPAVHLFTRPNEKDVVGATVVFSLSSPDEQSRSYATTTDAHGIARLNAWHFGSGWGTYQVVTKIGGASPVQFSAHVRGALIAIYDLVTIYNHQVPYDVVNEAHYLLYADGSYNHIYNAPADGGDPTLGGMYTRSSAGVIDFYIGPNLVSPFYSPSTHFLGTGTLDGLRMNVIYQDSFDFANEVYVAR
jgi:hypothetical protein